MLVLFWLFIKFDFLDKNAIFEMYIAPFLISRSLKCSMHFDLRMSRMALFCCYIFIFLSLVYWSFVDYYKYLSYPSVCYFCLTLYLFELFCLKQKVFMFIFFLIIKIGWDTYSNSGIKYVKQKRGAYFSF